MKKLQLIYACMALFLISSCQDDSDLSVRMEYKNRYLETAENIKVNGSSVSGQISEKKLRELVMQFHDIDEIGHEKYPSLLVEMFLSDYHDVAKTPNKTKRELSTGTVFCLAQVTINGTTYSTFDSQPYSSNNTVATEIRQVSDVPAGSYIEAYVVHTPAGQSSGIILSQDQLTTTSIVCNDDEVAEAQALWLNQNASTLANLRCEELGSFACNGTNSVCAVYETCNNHPNCSQNFTDLVERNKFYVEWDDSAISSSTVSIYLKKGSTIYDSVTDVVNDGLFDQFGLNFPRVSSNTSGFYVQVTGGGVTLNSQTFTVEND